MHAGSGGSSESPAPEQRAELARLIGGFRISQAIYVVAALGVADLLAGGPQGSDALAAATHADEDALFRVLRLLAGAGLFEEVAPRRFALTALGAGLRRDLPGSLRPTALHLLNAPHWRAWGELGHSVRTGEPGFERTHGMGLFAYLRAHPEAAASFNQGMTGNTAQSGDAIARAYDCAGIGRLVDVGGGHGLLLATLLRAYPTMHGILFDLPEVAVGAAPVLAEAGVADRCEVVGGDFFAGVPAGGDAYLLRQIIHDWDDVRAAAILAHCRRALPEAGRVLVVERAIAPDYQRALPVLELDMQMLVMLGGKQRTEAEYGALFARAGLRLHAVVPLGDPLQYSVFEGRPA